MLCKGWVIQVWLDFFMSTLLQSRRAGHWGCFTLSVSLKDRKGPLFLLYNCGSLNGSILYLWIEGSVSKDKCGGDWLEYRKNFTLFSDGRDLGNNVQRLLQNFIESLRKKASGVPEMPQRRREVLSSVLKRVHLPKPHPSWYLAGWWCFFYSWFCCERYRWKQVPVETLVSHWSFQL